MTRRLQGGPDDHIGGDAVEVVHERVAELLHLEQPLPAQCLQPAEEKAGHAVTSLVGPESIQLLPKHVGLEQATVDRE
jgi:hypothetical protein